MPCYCVVGAPVREAESIVHFIFALNRGCTDFRSHPGARSQHASPVRIRNRWEHARLVRRTPRRAGVRDIRHRVRGERAVAQSDIRLFGAALSAGDFHRRLRDGMGVGIARASGKLRIGMVVRQRSAL